MIKRELIDTVACKCRKPKAEVATVVNTTLDVIRCELINGGEVNLIGFGKFSVRNAAARKGRNPRTGEVINLPSNKRVHFKPGKNFKQAVNND